MVAESSPRISVDRAGSICSGGAAGARGAGVVRLPAGAHRAHAAVARSSPAGLSPRCSLNLLHAARAWALLDARNFVLPEDVQAVLAQRRASSRAVDQPVIVRGDGDEVARKLLAEVPLPLDI